MLFGGSARFVLWLLRCRDLRQLAGQAASIAASAVWSSEEPVTQAVSCCHSAPAPTAAGIMSEASNRDTVFGSCRICTQSLLIGPCALAMSRPLFAEMRDE